MLFLVVVAFVLKKMRGGGTQHTLYFHRWIDLGWLPDPYPAALSGPLLNRTGEENKVEKFVCHHKDREIT